MTATTNASELGREAATAIRDICRRIADGRTITMLCNADLTDAWARLTTGGWTDFGRHDDSDGPSVLDLVVIGQVWGETCLPLPLIPTILTRRWSRAAGHHTGPTTLAVPHPAQSGGLVPFGTYRRILLADDLDPACPEALTPVGAEPDDLAPTLALGAVDRVSRMPAECAHEIAVVWAAEAVGAARRMLDEAVAYAKLREQFGVPIGSFQAVKHLLADAHIAHERAETAMLWAATSPDDAPRVLPLAFRAARTVGEHSIQVHGGAGFTWELGLHFYLRHIMALTELTRGLLR
jgi:hypothetical protein